MLVAIMMFCTNNTYSQTYEVGPFIGGANYVGDIGSTTYISPNTLVGGIVAKWNRSTRHAFRFSLLRAEIEANDFDSDEGLRKQRGLFFENTITEASLGIEYTFWEWDPHSFEPQMTPYLYTGFTAFHAKGLYLEDGIMKEEDGDWNFSIPVVLGLKATVGSHLVLSAEIGPRYTFSDDLDGLISTENESMNPARSDWYMFMGVNLTYTFGRQPCYCSF